VVVRPVTSAADLDRFIALPYRLFRGDPYWVPPLRMDVKTLLSKKKNPFFQHAEAEYFLAVRRKGGQAVSGNDALTAVPPYRLNGEPWEVVGRIAAIHNLAHNQFHEDGAGFFGFFDAVDQQPVADALFDAAAAWLKARGLKVARGPASFSTNDECGLLVEGFDSAPTLLNPHNPPYYVALLERAGFQKAKDLYQYQSTNPSLPERLIQGARVITQRKKITLRKLDMKHFDQEVERIKQLYNAAWEKNWGFVPMTDAEIDHLAKQLKPVVVPDLVVFAEREGQLIGFAAALPDLNVALKRNPSGRLFPGIVKVLWAARRITRIRILLLGLLKEYRMTGADALMYHWIWEKGYALGYRWAEAGWILDDNTVMINALQRLGFERYKTLRLYDRAL
jgi:GNAT superfamily N-acetyltransferase